MGRNRTRSFLPGISESNRSGSPNLCCATVMHQNAQTPSLSARWTANLVAYLSEKWFSGDLDGSASGLARIDQKPIFCLRAEISPLL
jgi:hypothetical protein